MITIKDKMASKNIDEGILSSTKTGRGQIVKDWVEKNFRYGYGIEYDENTGNVSLTTGKVFIKQDIPVVFDTVKNVEFEKCTNEVLSIPKKFESVKITECEKLKKITTNGESRGDVLIIEKCNSLEDLDLDNLYVNSIIINSCDSLKSIEHMKYVINSLTVKSCKNLKDYDLNNQFGISINIYRCKIKNFKRPIIAESFTLDNVLKVKDLKIDIVTCKDVIVKNCKTLEKLDIIGNPILSMVIDNNEELKTIQIHNDIKYSLSICNMQKLESITSDKKIKSFTTYRNTNIKPEIGKMVKLRNI